MATASVHPASDMRTWKVETILSQLCHMKLLVYLILPKKGNIGQKKGHADKE